MSYIKYRGEFIGEFIGTYLLVLFGCGSIAVSVLFDAHHGLLPIALIWGVGVSLAVYATRHLSCAHLNPAVTLAMVTSKRMAVRKIPAYLSAQFLGAFLAGLTVYILFKPSIETFEITNHIIRGTAESVRVAKMFGAYYQQTGSNVMVSMPLAIGAEFFGTFLLVFMIFSLTEGCNLGRPDNNLSPIFIGLTVTSIICLLAPLTQAGLNPARDLGPRLVAWFFGWGVAAFPDQAGGFLWVYIAAPVIGGQTAAFLFTRVLEPIMRIRETSDCNRCN